MKMLSFNFSFPGRKIRLRRVQAGSLFTISILGFGCQVNSFYEAPAVRVSRSVDIVPPPGMVYVSAGSIYYKGSSDTGAPAKKVSLSPFFIDETEVTNKQYQAFVNWVADSIAIVDYLNDEKYFLEDNSSELVGKPRKINWNKVSEKHPLWESPDPEIRSKLNDLVLEEAGKRVLNRNRVKFSFILPGASNYPKADTIAVVPDHDVWIKDFPNSQMSFMTQNYFSHLTFDNHPVVGVSWKQARAYAFWRGLVQGRLLSKWNYLKAYNLTFSLPTEAQWQYAATGVRESQIGEENSFVSYYDRRSKAERFLANFKQEQGDYVDDGSIFPLPVKSYRPNNFGVFNMAGNVSEWTIDAFSPSAAEFVHDLNPVLLHEAKDDDPVVMKRKVVRGGSWKDNATLLDVENRTYELQDVPHSYIGFRCVMAAPEVISDQVRTRKQQKTAQGGTKSTRPKKAKYAKLSAK